MVAKSAKEVLQEIQEARQQIEHVSIIMDGAVAHFIVESLTEALTTAAISYLSVRDAIPEDWNNEYGTQSELKEASRELGLTGIAAIKTLVEALPDSLKTSFSYKPAPLDKVKEILMRD